MTQTVARPTRRSPQQVLIQDNLPREHGFEALDIEGALPADLRGTLYRNGPGQFELFGRRYGHPFEADGAISAVRIDAGGARGAARVTASAGLIREREAGRMLYGFSAPWTRRVRSALRGQGKNTANTSVIAWQGRLLALMEAANPTEIAPDDLRTLGETDLGGVVRGAFSAHPHHVAARRATYNFGVRHGRETLLDLYELPDVGDARLLASVPLPFGPMLHDFIATRDHLVFLISPVRVRVMRALSQTGPFSELFEWAPELGTHVLVVPIDAPDRARRFTAPAFFQWHFANGFERDGDLVIDLVRYDDFRSFGQLGQDLGFDLGTLCRITVDTRREELRTETVSDVPCEFPRVHPDREGDTYRHTWMITQGGTGLARLDMDTGDLDRFALDPGQMASEPVFVPRTADAAGDRGETDGYALSLIYDARRHASHLAVFDAARLADGPLARAWFDHHIPVTFHGNWLPASGQG